MKAYVKLFVLVAALGGFLVIPEYRTGAQTDPCQANCSAMYQSCITLAQDAYDLCAANAEINYLQCLNDADSAFGDCEYTCFATYGGNSAYTGCVNACYNAQSNAYAMCESAHDYALGNCQAQQNSANSFCEDGLTHCQILCP